jgi:ketosteroid isomerase-like protein
MWTLPRGGENIKQILAGIVSRWTRWTPRIGLGAKRCATSGINEKVWVLGFGVVGRNRLALSGLNGHIQEKKVHFCGFKTGCWWYTFTGRKAKKENQAASKLVYLRSHRELRDGNPGEEANAMEKRLVLTIGMAICLGFSVGCQRPAGLSDTDRTAIRQADENDMKLMNAKDWKGDSALYAEDAILLPPNQAAVQGKAAIQAWMEAFPPFSNFQEQSLEIEGQGDLAYDRGTYSMTVIPPGAAPIEDHGKYLTIWRKQDDGSWKVQRGTFNSDLPLPAPGKPAATAKKAKKK